MANLRKAIDDYCRSCTHDNLAPGTWRQQITLCSVKNCPLWQHRPRTTRAIPESVLVWYGIKIGEFE